MGAQVSAYCQGVLEYTCVRDHLGGGYGVPYSIGGGGGGGFTVECLFFANAVSLFITFEVMLANVAPSYTVYL